MHAVCACCLLSQHRFRIAADQVIHPSVQEFTDIAANCFTVSAGSKENLEATTLLSLARWQLIVRGSDKHLQDTWHQRLLGCGATATEEGMRTCSQPHMYPAHLLLSMLPHANQPLLPQAIT